MEDEVLIAEVISRYLRQDGYQCASFATHYEEALQQINTLQPDLVLLDIRLKGGRTGIEIANWMRAQQLGIPFVFLTSQTDQRYLDLAKQTYPAGYLVKPVQRDTLRATIAMALHASKRPILTKEKSITLANGAEKIKVLLSDITYIESDHVYVNIYTQDGRKILHRSTLAELQRKLPSSQFPQIHRSFIVQLKYVESWNKDSVRIQNQSIPVSRSRRAEVFQLLENLTGQSGGQAGLYREGEEE
ncbi:MAG: LytTR family transcriptional regulator DNA-binding domain-containing protein [Saprospiraceae bacterium]